MGYGVIFLAGIINDVVIGFPIGISSVDYLFLCGNSILYKKYNLKIISN